MYDPYILTNSNGSMMFPYSGKSVTKEENEVWLRIFKRVSEGRGETIIDQWYEDNEKYINAFCGVWQNALRGYVEVVSKKPYHLSTERLLSKEQ